MNIHDFLAKYRTPVFNKEDETGGGDAGDAGAAGGDTGGDDAGLDRTPPEHKSGLGGGLLDRRSKEGDDKGADTKPADDAKPADGRPENIPEKFWKDGQTDVDGMAKAYAELEKAHGKLKRDKQGLGDDLPETAGDYFKDGLELEGVERLKIEGPEDPGLMAWGEVCHKHGIGKELATNLAKEMFQMMDKHAEAPLDPDAEFDKLGKGGQALIDGVFVWADGLERSGRISESDAAVIADLSKTADGIKFLASMRQAAGEERIPLVEPTGGRHMTADTWREEYKEAVAKRDYKRQEELDAMSEDVFGSAPSHGGRPGGVDANKSRLKRS